MCDAKVIRLDVSWIAGGESRSVQGEMTLQSEAGSSARRVQGAECQLYPKPFESCLRVSEVPASDFFSTAAGEGARSWVQLIRFPLNCVLVEMRSAAHRHLGCDLTTSFVCSVGKLQAAATYLVHSQRDAWCRGTA